MNRNLQKSSTAWLLGLALLLAFSHPTLADSGVGSSEQIVNGYRVQLVLAAPVKTGDTDIQINLLDSQGQPVSQALVQFTAVLSADAHAGNGAHGHQSDEGGATRLPHEISQHAAGNSPHDAPMAGADHSHPIGHALRPTGQAGEYAGTFTFEKPGPWQISVLFFAEGQEHEAHFPLNVAPVDYAPAVLTIFLGLNAAIIASAAVMRRKSLAA